MCRRARANVARPAAVFFVAMLLPQCGADAPIQEFRPGPNSRQHRFPIVLLSTFPRSGNSWLRELIRYGSGWTTKLSTTMDSDGDNVNLADLLQYYRCDAATCDDESIRARLKLYVKPTANQTFAHVPHGIKPGDAEKPQEAGASRKCSLAEQPQEDTSFMRPVMIKSHFPAVSGKNSDTTMQLMRGASRVLHLVRNPWDNIVSRFHGNGGVFKKVGSRYTSLEKLRKAGGDPEATTQVFDNYLTNQLSEYVRFHDFWISHMEHHRQNGGGDTATRVQYTRYEDLTDHVESIFPAMLDFAGFQTPAERVDCVLQTFPAHHKNGSLPEHVDMLTPKQITRIYEGTKHLLDMFGYKFDPSTKKLTFGDPTIPMAN